MKTKNINKKYNRQKNVNKNAKSKLIINKKLKKRTVINNNKRKTMKGGANLSPQGMMNTAMQHPFNSENFTLVTMKLAKQTNDIDRIKVIARQT
jgi:hypothetical protein